MAAIFSSLARQLSQGIVWCQPGIVWGVMRFPKNPAALGVDVELVDGRDLAA